MFDRFSDEAKQSLSHAGKAALELKHQYIGTEHLLLGLLRVPHAIGTHVLDDLGIARERVRDEVLDIAKPGERDVTADQLPFTPRSKKVLELTMEEAARRGDRTIHSGHLLLGLLGEGEGVAALALRGLGLDLGRTRAAVAALTVAPTAPGAAPTPTSAKASHPLIATLQTMQQQLATEKEAAVAAQAFAIAAELRDLEYRTKAAIAAIAKSLDAGSGSPPAGAS